MNSKSLLNQCVTGAIYKALPAFTRVSEKPFRMAVLVMVFIISGVYAQAQTTAIPTGSFIINMGVTPQTVNNGLQPYGMIYDLLKNYNVPIIWSINPSKIKDGIDFSHNGIDYRGGTFIVPAEFRTTAVNARITYWQGQGVAGATTVSPITVPLYEILRSAPKWTLDKKNGAIAAGYFVRASIPASAHGGASSTGWEDPADLDCCDDIFAMPHADPVWSTHANLIPWNLNCKGAIWSACHAGSALENMVNPGNRSQQSNFLTIKDPAWTGATGAYTLSNSLILWGSHVDGSPPYTHRLPTNPVMQFMGTIDAATTNGSEQIFIPRQGVVSNPSTYSATAVARWNPGANILVFDPTQSNVTNPNPDLRNVAAVMMYGRGYDDPNRGWVMYEAGHSHNKADAPANVAAMRAFFNFSFLVSNEKVVLPTLATIPPVISGGAPLVLSYNLPPGAIPENFIAEWSSSCGGTFSPNGTNTSNPTTFTPPTVLSSTPCVITVTITDPCGRTGFDSQSTIIDPCQLSITRTVTSPLCFGNANGEINMVITGSAGPYTWEWTRVSPAGTGSGSGTSITGLSAGTYNVTVIADDDCEGNFTTVVTQPNALTATPTAVNYLCFGQTGAINLAVNGGTSPYTYSWTGPGGPYATQNLSGLTAGTYNVTVTDAKFCTAAATATVTGPASAVSVALDNKTDINCNGANNGAINITASGGNPGYSYLWSDGSVSEDRSGLPPGTYTVTVTDVNGCTGTLTETISQPPALIVSVVASGPTCPPGSFPPVNANGEIAVTASGGLAPYNVSWTGPLSGNPAGVEIAASGGSYLISNLQAGTYTVTVSDANACTATVNVTITEQNPLPAAPININNN